jgi:hypothetical protein
MGLDIHLDVANKESFFPNDYHDEKHDHFHKHGLSRTFCIFMNRDKLEGNQEPELDVLGSITSIDISPLYDMETYSHDNDEHTLFRLEMAESEEEAQQVLEEAKQSREKLEGNIDIVLSTINSLIDKLSRIDNLTQLLEKQGVDMDRYHDYFTDFNTDKGDGYMHNNFGQDLRNFKRYVEYAKDKGATTVYFRYG